MINVGRSYPVQIEIEVVNARTMMSCDKRSAMNLDLNLTGLQRDRTVSLSDLVFDELLSPMKTSSGNCHSVTSASMTPTPTQFLFPTSVTADQEAYASGFVRALEEIYRSEGQLSNRPRLVASTEYTPAAASSQLTTLNNVTRFSSFASPPSYSAATARICPGVIWPRTKVEDFVRSSPSSCVQPAKTYLSYLPTANCFDSSSVTHSASAASSSIFTQLPCRTSTLNVDSSDQPSDYHMMVPICASSSKSTGAGSHYSMSSVADSTVSGPPTKVDMDEQEQWRLERKRAKNRVAAARCQMRKMERITRLQEKVQALRDNNARLAQTAAELTKHVSTLRNQILMHTERGCRMMIPALS